MRRVELLQRDDPDPRQDRVEATDVRLEVIEREPVLRELGEAGVDELPEPDQSHPTVRAKQAPDLRQEVTVVAEQQDVSGAIRQCRQGALDPDVDDLLAGAAAQGDRPVVHGEQRLDEGHGQRAGAGVEEEQALDRLVPETFGELPDPFPARPFLGIGPPAEHAVAEGRVDVLTVDDEVRAHARRIRHARGG